MFQAYGDVPFDSGSLIEGRNLIFFFQEQAYRPVHTLHGFKGSLNLAKLDPVSHVFNLKILPPVEIQKSVPAVAGQVAGPVYNLRITGI